MVDRPDVDTPQGAQPTGTNGRRQHTNPPPGGAAASTRLRNMPAAMNTNTHRRSKHHGTRVHHPVPKPPEHPDPSGSEELKIRGGHGLGETPGPIPNPEAKTQHGNGTAPGRVWESSTPPPQHLHKGGILRRTFLRTPPFSISTTDQHLAVPVFLHKAVRETIKHRWAEYQRSPFTCAVCYLNLASTDVKTVAHFAACRFWSGHLE